MTIHVQNLAGAVLAFNVPVGATVIDLKRRVHDAPERLVECSLSRQRMFVVMDAAGRSRSAFASEPAASVASAIASNSDSNTDKTSADSTGSISTVASDTRSPAAADAVIDGQNAAESTHVTLDDNARTLASHGIAHETTVYVIALDRACARVYDGRSVSAAAAQQFAFPQPAGVFSRPRGVCVSSTTDELFVADSGNGRVQVLRASDGTHLRTFELRDEPVCVCLSPVADELYVGICSRWSGFATSVCVVRASDGAPLRTYGGGGLARSPIQLGDSELFDQPKGVCLTRAGDVMFVADTEHHKVQSLRVSDGAPMHTYSGSRCQIGCFKFTFGVAISEATDELFISDCGNHRVVVLRISDGAHVRTLGGVRGRRVGQLKDPRGLCLSEATDELLVADRDNHRVHVFRASDGTPLHTFGGPTQGKQRGEFSSPEGVCVSAHTGEAFVADTGNNRIQVLML